MIKNKFKTIIVYFGKLLFFNIVSNKRAKYQTVLNGIRCILHIIELRELIFKNIFVISVTVLNSRSENV